MGDWLLQLQNVKLSAPEKEALERFQSNPHSRSFLAVAEILIRHRMIDSAIPLLQQGVQAHPAYAVARVVLGELLFQQGLFDEAWDILEDSPVSLRSNKSAQLLKFKVALARCDADIVNVLIQEIIHRHQFDAFTHEWIRRVEAEEFLIVRQSFLDHLRSQGIPVNADYYDRNSLPGGAAPGDSLRESWPDVESTSKNGSHEEAEALMEQHIEGFFVSSVKQIFLHRKKKQQEPQSRANMDPMTLARVYRKQGLYEKSLEVFRRLLYMAPNNDLLKKEVAELEALRDEQRRQEKEYDPELAERLDEVRQIDKQIGFLNQMLDALEQYESRKEI